MSKHGLIYSQHDNNAKCEISIQNKMTKKPFPQSIEIYKF